jgi:putative CocE/NonD family hydrolase
MYAGTRVEHDWIPMKDGTRLAVNLFFPANAHPTDKFPVILEYLPYRKDDWALERDYGLYSYFSRFGYVGARVDIRGTGASEGHPPDREYSDQEQLDGMEVIAWLASRGWSNGSVGMQGISWGGFNSIQMAMRHPPALKAIISVDSTDDLFHDDIHYIDGMMHADEFELGMDQELMTTAAPDFPLDEKNLKARFDSDPGSRCTFTSSAWGLSGSGRRFVRITTRCKRRRFSSADFATAIATWFLADWRISITLR